MKTKTHGPSPAQDQLITKLLNEKTVPAHLMNLVDDFHVGQLSGHDVSTLIEGLLAVKSPIVAPSSLPPQDLLRAKAASVKQVDWVQRLLKEKDIPDNEKLVIQGFLDEGLSGTHAGRILDYLFDRPLPGGQPQGFLGEVGQKITVSGVLTIFRTIYSDFGSTNLIIITTPEGQAVKTFSNAKGFKGFKEGDPITITATVKKHDTHKGAEFTVVRLPKVMS